MKKGRHQRPKEQVLFSERLLARLWRERAVRVGALQAQNGDWVRVLYPGRPGTSAGPDFRDALLYVEGLGLTRGDVELHLRQGDWQAHGHHRDHRYNSVALHVVYATEDKPTPMANGATAPVVSARSLLETLPPAQPSRHLWRLLERCGYPQPSTLEGLAEVLDQAGDARFQEKADTFRGQAQEVGAEQAIYAALMEGLGYSQNQAPFWELAHRMPIADLKAQALALPQSQRRPALEAWLLQAAGLGQQPMDGQALNMGGDDAPPLRWHLFRVRPGNHPGRRLAGMAWLLDCYLEGGLMSGLAQGMEGGASALERGLVVRSEGRALIGPDRARELAVNAALPGLVAWGRLQGEASLAEEAVALYHRFPKMPDNEVHREMADLLMPAQWRTIVNCARRQQGLLHMQRLLARTDFRPASSQ